MKFSFTTFFEIQLMPAARPVRVAASMIVLTSLLSDIVILKKIFFQLASLAGSQTSSFVEIIRQAISQHALVNSYQTTLITKMVESLMGNSNFAAIYLLKIELQSIYLILPSFFGSTGGIPSFSGSTGGVKRDFISSRL